MQKILRCLAVVIILLWLRTLRQQSQKNPHFGESLAPLVREYIDSGVGYGGRWYIPPSWTEHEFDLPEPRTPAEAATAALELAMREKRFLNNTKIPLIIHQTWKSLASATWTDLVRNSVNEWLEVAEGGSPETPSAAYILWDDKGVDEFLQVYEASSWKAIEMLPYNVEKADVFRVAVLKWFGGVYADIDTKPLKHPFQWIQNEDVQPWTDPTSMAQYTLHVPKIKSYHAPQTPTVRRPRKAGSGVNDPWSGYEKTIESNVPDDVNIAAIVGIEADNYPDTDSFWRMGYLYALQLTNWAMAMAPHHPISSYYLTHVTDTIMQNATRLKEVEILELSGPPAWTKAVKELCEWDDPHFDWNALSSRADPRSATGKVAAGDIAVLPITGFSPGRSNLWPHRSMGSQPLDHPQARLLHQFANTWRSGINPKVEAGKLCRKLLGHCRDWKKNP